MSTMMPESENIETKIRRHAKAYRFLVVIPTIIPAGPESRRVCSLSNAASQATHISLFLSNNHDAEEDVHITDLPDTRWLTRITRFVKGLNKEITVVANPDMLSKNNDERMLKA